MILRDLRIFVATFNFKGRSGSPVHGGIRGTLGTKIGNRETRLTMLQITERLAIPLAEIELEAVRSSGAGGQNVNKVSTAVVLRFDIRGVVAARLDKERLLALSDSRITGEGVVLIKAQQHRSQIKNRDEALSRSGATGAWRYRYPPQPSPHTAHRRFVERRLQAKKQRGAVKAQRRSGGVMRTAYSQHAVRFTTRPNASAQLGAGVPPGGNRRPGNRPRVAARPGSRCRGCSRARRSPFHSSDER